MRPALSTRLVGWALPLWSEAAALARSALMARAIGGEELGRAMVLTLVLRLAEMLSDVGIERLLAQRPGAVGPGLLAALHGVAVLRGLGGAAILLALAVPLAAAFPGGAGAGAHAMLALVPLMRGFAHLDCRLAERALRLRPLAVVEAGAVLAMLAALPPALMLLDDHRAMLPVLLAQAGAQLALSHLVAATRYRIRLERAVLAEALGFGAPLVLNAALMFLTFQADRLIVAGWYGWAEVAVYGVALQLAMLPAQIAGRAAGSLLAPRLRAAGQSQLRGVARQAVLAHAGLGAGFAAAFALAAPPAIALVFGAAFRPDGALAVAFGLAAGARIARTPLSLLALACGRSGDPARANLWRAAALGPALLAASLGLPLLAVAASAALGEALATLRALHLARTVLIPSTARQAFA
jgi:O-antigen/teichoic acid export membrane protein